jgi:hypothetical protein
MAPSRALLSVPTMPSPLCPPSSLELGQCCFHAHQCIDPLYWNFSRDALPDVFKDAPQFLLNNPIALQRRYLKLKDDPNMRAKEPVSRSGEGQRAGRVGNAEYRGTL